MAIVAAAVVPHSPLLIPTIAKSHIDRSAQTRAAFVELGQELYAIQPDVIAVLTPHGQTINGAIAIEQGDSLVGHLRDFGDLQTTLTIPGAVQLAHRLKEAAEDADVPAVLQSRVGLDYGVIVPWLCLWPNTAPYHVMPISVGRISTEQMLRFGQLLRNFFLSRPERVVLLASGDTNRRPEGSTDADRRPTTVERALSEAITHVDLTRLPTYPLTDVCLADPLMILLRSLQGSPITTTIRSFEVPLSVGQMVVSLFP